MAMIKSALDLALERTKDIASDKASLRAKETKERGMRLFSQIYDSPDFDAAQEITKAPKEDQEQLRRGLFQTALTRLQLPQTEAALHDLPAVTRALIATGAEASAATQIMDQLQSLFDRYLQDRDQLYNAVVQQYTPVLRQKEQQLAQQTGRKVTLTPEQDPEFQKYFKQNLDQLEEQYQQMVDQARSQLQTLTGL
ncbi:DUF6657 family protein [Spirochaeta lutea]|uniref:Uncharacterized protein n=1 Tax=Spirochaeta lutea TaxID=1480694 RepID=A0A098QUK1_9SPIO|nr:DUF6657 family protein [Spirochaeta lutea]KGE71251.1 hypothetical protein DC28_12450 [Spirochaeta lutea]